MRLTRSLYPAHSDACHVRDPVRQVQRTAFVFEDDQLPVSRSDRADLTCNVMPSNRSAQVSRPFGITALIIFFFAATGIALVTAISLLFPHGFLESIWKLNPRARISLGAIGVWAPLLFFVVAVACATAAIGLWRGARLGYWIAIAILTINAIGDLVNAILGTKQRALIGIPVVVVILAYLFSRKVRSFFSSHDPSGRLGTASKR
jgi:hypothetical protein